MSLPILPTVRPPVRNALNNLATSLVALVATAFLALSQSAHSAPPVAPNPSFPVGSLRAYPTMIQIGHKPTLTWSIDLPPDSNTADYTFHIRQKILPSGVTYDMTVEAEGETLSALPINPGRATFELLAVRSSDSRTYLLDSTTSGPYLPITSVTITSEDPYPYLPRTRADRPFSVSYTVSGLISDPAAPEAAKGVTLVHHVQPYSSTGTGDPLDRTQATALPDASITTNGTASTFFPATQIPGENRAKIRGEERLSIFTRPSIETDPYTGLTYTAPAYHLDSQFVQIWPVADASITGITHGQILGSTFPQLTCQLNDLYPKSTTWAQVYQGAPQDGHIGTIIPESVIALNTTIPSNSTITLDNYGAYIATDGLWTIELCTETPFGIDRLARVSFIVRRTGTTINDWRQTHFGSFSNTGDGADENDYDHDGIPNIIEFAFGFDPKQNNAGQLPLPERTAAQLALRFTPPAGITGIRYRVESSTTLLPDSWSPVPNTGTLPENLFTLPTTGKPQLFLRLTAEQP